MTKLKKRGNKKTNAKRTGDTNRFSAKVLKEKENFTGDNGEGRVKKQKVGKKDFRRKGGVGSKREGKDGSEISVRRIIKVADISGSARYIFISHFSGSHRPLGRQ